MARRDTSAEIDAAAADWASRVDNAPLSPSEQDELDDWLTGDKRRLGAYARARAMFAHAARIKALGPTFDPDAFLTTAEAERLRNVGPAAAAPPDAAFENPADTVREAFRPSRRRFILAGGGAAVAASVALVGFGWQAAAQTYSTRRGEIRLVPLEDGSSMTLNTETTAEVRFGDRQRRVELVRGEALFDVAEDPQRQFVVAAGDTEVRAVGTSFSVRRLENAPVEVVVRHGLVEVARPEIPNLATARIGSNTRAVVSGSAPLATASVAPAELGRALAWREGMLWFEDMPLRAAAMEFARYSDTRILFADPTIGEEPVTGLYSATNPAGFARAVASSLDLQAESTPRGIVLRR